MTRDGARRLIQMELVKNKNGWKPQHIRAILSKISNKSKELDVEVLKDVACQIHDIKRNDIDLKRRIGSIVEARAHCYLYLFENGYSYSEIARLFNKKSHATIMHAVNSTLGYLEFDAQTRVKYEKLNEIMKHELHKSESTQNQ